MVYTRVSSIARSDEVPGLLCRVSQKVTKFSEQQHFLAIQGSGRRGDVSRIDSLYLKELPAR